jgi:hypothetical protein
MRAPLVKQDTRSDDLDPGLVWYLAQTESITARRFNEMVNFQSGLPGISETSSNGRDFRLRTSIPYTIGIFKRAQALDGPEISRKHGRRPRHVHLGSNMNRRLAVLKKDLKSTVQSQRVML